jgi:uncharacterized membrane protein
MIDLMKIRLVAYAASLLPMLALDGTWLAAMGGRFYKVRIGHLMSPAPQLAPAAAFYFVYAAALAILVVVPCVRAGSGGGKAFALGALLGFAAYATYDLTNQATLRDWPFIVTVVDMAWGTFLTGIAALAAYALTRRFA